MKLRPAAALAALTIFAAGAAAADDCAGPPTATKLVVEVGGARNAKGQVAITVYPDSQKRFLAPGGKLLRARVPIHGDAAGACFWLPAPGSYAVAVYHDANGDRDFNRNLRGLPNEGFGFSNDAPTKYGLPSLGSVRFRVGPGDTRIRIKLRYAS